MATQLEKWVKQQAELLQPEKIYWCDGSEEEARRLIQVGIKEENIEGHPIFQELNQKTFPNCYYHKSHHTDVARTEHLTFVCHPDKETAGPNNNWMHPDEAKKKLKPGLKRLWRRRFISWIFQRDANSRRCRKNSMRL